MPLSTSVNQRHVLESVFNREIDTDTIERAEAIGQRLAGELRAVVNTMPSDSRRIRAMADRLGVNRNICQRVLKAIRAGQDGSATLLALPGVEGLLKFSQGAKRSGCDPEQIESLVAAIDQFASLIQDSGGSHARLQFLLEEAMCEPQLVLTGSASNQALIRKHLFLGASALLGSEMNAHVLIVAIRPSPGDATQLEVAGVTGFIDEQLQPNAQPLTVAFSHFGQGEDESKPSYQALGESGLLGQASLLEKLCSSPIPRVTSRRGKESIVHMIDPEQSDRKTPFTVAIGNRLSTMKNPAYLDVKVLNVAARIRNPTRRLVYDVYLHRSIAAMSVPSLVSFLWHPALSEDPVESWHERLPDDNHIALLGRGIGNAACNAWDKHVQATQHLFESLDWAPNEYIAHRIDIPFPLWGAWYYFSMDFHTDFQA